MKLLLKYWQTLSNTDIFNFSHYYQLVRVGKETILSIFYRSSFSYVQHETML